TDDADPAAGPGEPRRVLPAGGPRRRLLTVPRPGGRPGHAPQQAGPEAFGMVHRRAFALLGARGPESGTGWPFTAAPSPVAGRRRGFRSRRPEAAPGCLSPPRLHQCFQRAEAPKQTARLGCGPPGVTDRPAPETGTRLSRPAAPTKTASSAEARLKGRADRRGRGFAAAPEGRAPASQSLTGVALRAALPSLTW